MCQADTAIGLTHLGTVVNYAKVLWKQRIGMAMGLDGQAGVQRLCAKGRDEMRPIMVSLSQVREQDSTDPQIQTRNEVPTGLGLHAVVRTLERSSNGEVEEGVPGPRRGSGTGGTFRAASRFPLA